MNFNITYSTIYINFFLNKIMSRGKKNKNYKYLILISLFLKQKNIKLSKLLFYILLKLKTLFFLKKIKKKNKKKKK